ncbi:hypothetical protein M0R04_09010 [Candidatus Dojkabacteria bacterium]|jgi:hypothetical protein|nr:hypothetical protein [Candidatus Dojkabacteria bacterium]
MKKYKEYKITDKEIKQIRKLASLENDIEINLLLDDIIKRAEYGNQHA